MSLVNTDVTVDLAEIENEDLDRWCFANGIAREKLPEISFSADVEIDASSLDDEEIVDRYEEMTRSQGEWFERVYRLLAENDCKAAMDEMQREFGLASPSHERAIADLLSPLGGARG
ncbi:hypothetical protein C8J36_103551 [Rhizobium sp. PP-F2F-G48]|uniref:hypothetical protein n=1 Tax=Rhizobium sp. PP-F2F-G48 TaxID=2135651 RepID=UPI00104A3685|nr:hypothetical protein [Rhizobium sp. PP-F2F-G48]TCM56181.1 hypothetical protein C8J36_103551 [Rhizobium sp. PP-F2F-G48]